MTVKTDTAINVDFIEFLPNGIFSERISKKDAADKQGKRVQT